MNLRSFLEKGLYQGGEALILTNVYWRNKTKRTGDSSSVALYRLGRQISLRKQEAEKISDLRNGGLMSDNVLLKTPRDKLGPARLVNELSRLLLRCDYAISNPFRKAGCLEGLLTSFQA